MNFPGILNMLVVSVILLSPLFIACAMASCSMANWETSFDKQGYSICEYSNEYLNGLERGANGGSNDGISRLEKGRCCPRPRPYWNQPTLCVIADWETSFDYNYRWSNCPQGFFMIGMNRGSGSKLNDIKYGKCCKPANHPYWYGECYDEDVTTSFDKPGISKCRDGFFLASLFRGNCDKLSCIERFKCCQTYPSPPQLTSLADVKTRVMDVTLRDLSNLAHLLGYGWCASCRAPYVGEDFKRNGDSWHADTAGPCEGYKANQRLKIHYGNFKFSIKNIQYGDPVYETLQSRTFDSGRVTNREPSPLTHKVEREIRSVRTVTHTTTTSWKKAHELGVEISYTPPDSTGGVGGKVSYKFNYENSESNTESTGNQDYKSINVLSQKVLQPHSAASYKIMLTKTRSTVPYTATIIAHFTAELDGFLRWGGGENGDNTNYHYQHRGSGDRPTFKYTFGNTETPFYTALKQESDRNKEPWQWNDLKTRYNPEAQNRINNLVDEGRYEFLLTGKFVDVIGQQADVEWNEESLEGGKRSDVNGTDTKPKEEFQEPVTEEDPPEVNPPPPKVKIHVGKLKSISTKHKSIGE